MSVGGTLRPATPPSWCWQWGWSPTPPSPSSCQWRPLASQCMWCWHAPASWALVRESSSQQYSTGRANGCPRTGAPLPTLCSSRVSIAFVYHARCMCIACLTLGMAGAAAASPQICPCRYDCMSQVLGGHLSSALVTRARVQSDFLCSLAGHGCD